MIKRDITNYRNSHKESRVLLGVLLGEFSKIEKAPKRKTPEITDEECINVIKTLMASNIECGELEENKLLQQFIPAQLSIDEISDIIKFFNFQNIKDCMNYFKTNHAGLYDGKIVSSLFNSLIN